MTDLKSGTDGVGWATDNHSRITATEPGAIWLNNRRPGTSYWFVAPERQDTRFEGLTYSVPIIRVMGAPDMGGRLDSRRDHRGLRVPPAALRAPDVRNTV